MPERAPEIETVVELAQELRDLAAILVENEINEEAARLALESIRNFRPQLTGARRLRWYEQDAPTSFVGDEAKPFDLFSPVRGQLNASAPPFTMEAGTRDDGSPCILGRVTMSPVYEGPPRGVHGGWVAALFDEILGAVMEFAPPPGVTAKLEVRYHHLTPIEEPLRFEAWLTEDHHRRVQAQATCHAGDTLTASSKALFVRVDFKELGARMRARAKR